MAQPEIKFIMKLVNMRKAANKLGANRKEGVMDHVIWFERHIKANGYKSSEMAKSFFIRELERVAYIMFWGKPSLAKEFKSLNIVEYDSTINL